MRFIEIANLSATNLQVRHLASAHNKQGAVLAVCMGDGQHTHSVHWLRWDDAAEYCRRGVPVFAGAPQPVVASDLTFFAYAENQPFPNVVIGRALASDPVRVVAVSAPSIWEEDSRAIRSLGLSTNGRRLLVSYADSDLAGFAIPQPLPESGDEVRLQLTSSLVETISPADVMACGNGPAFGQLIGRPNQEDVFITANEGLGNIGAENFEPECFDLDRGPAPRAAAFSPDARWLAIGQGQVVLLYQVTGWRLPQPTRLFGHSGAITGLAFHPNSDRLASVGSEGVARLWDLASGQLIRYMSSPMGSYGGVAFHPDGQSCVVGGQEGRLMIWDLDEPLPGAWPYPNDPVWQRVGGAAVSPAVAAPVPASASAPVGARWVLVDDVSQLPGDAVPVGREADGTRLYAARSEHRGGVYLGKVRYGFAGANVGYRRREITLLPFEVLVGEAVWEQARNGQIPETAIPCGRDEKGTVFYLARGTIGEGVHPGRIAAGMTAARLPFGGVEVDVAEYEVLVRDTLGDEPDESDQADETLDLSREPLVYWDFENVMSENGISTSVGISSAPRGINGFVSQTGGGPAEVWPQTGTVFLTRYLGTNRVFLWLTVTAPTVLEAMTFRHWHNHNLSFPTADGYQIQVQLETAGQVVDLGKPLLLSNETSGRTDTIWLGRLLQSGSYRLSWSPRGLRRGRDTGSEFLAFKDLRLDGRVVSH